MSAKWATKPLGAICEFSNGLWTGKKPPFVKAIVVRNTNFRPHGRLDHSDVALLDVEAKQLAKRRLQLGDIIIEKSGGGPKQPVGRVAYFDKSNGVYSFSNFTAAARVIDRTEVDPEYLIRFLDWCYISGVTEGMQSHSTGIRNLDFSAYKAIEVPLPPVEEQRRIVAVLDEAFAAIAIGTADAEKNLANADHLFASVLANALHEDARDWERRELQALLQAGRKISYGIVKPGKHDPDGIRLIKSQQVRDGYMDLSADFRITKALDAEYARTRLRGGEILLNLVGASIGRSAVAPPELAGANVSRAIAVIPVRDDLAAWVQYNLRGFVGQQLIQARTGGAAQPVLNLSEVKALPVSIPPVSQRDAIVRRLDALSSEVSNLADVHCRKIDALARLRQSLLHGAFAGELTAAIPETITA